MNQNTFFIWMTTTNIAIAILNLLSLYKAFDKNISYIERKPQPDVPQINM